MQALDLMTERPDSTSPASGEAFDRMLAEFHEPIRRLVYRLVGWRRGADDVVQEVFLSAWGAWPRFANKDRPELWLKRIAINKCRSRLRREVVRARWFNWFFDTRLGEPAELVEDSLIVRERAARVRAAIGSLGPSYREVAVLYYLEQMDMGEIATVIGSRRNTVEVRLHRARLRLKELLSDMME
jgi:RNA polymerase sigma-70 factor (ECF subfamily)